MLFLALAGIILWMAAFFCAGYGFIRLHDGDAVDFFAFGFVGFCCVVVGLLCFQNIALYQQLTAAMERLQ